MNYISNYFTFSTQIFSFFLSLTYLLVVVVEGYCGISSHTHILGRTSLDEGSAQRRDLYLNTNNTRKRQTFMLPAGLEPAIPAIERP
jgi:hypothetical protein